MTTRSEDADYMRTENIRQYYDENERCNDRYRART